MLSVVMAFNRYAKYWIIKGIIPRKNLCEKIIFCFFQSIYMYFENISHYYDYTNKCTQSPNSLPCFELNEKLSHSHIVNCIELQWKKCR